MLPNRYFAFLKTCLLSIGLLGLVTRSTLAQVIVPPGAAATDAPAAVSGILNPLALTHQIQYSAAQLTALSLGQQIVGIQFRLDRFGTPRNLVFPNFMTVLSQAANSITGMSDTYANNILNPVTVFNGPLSFPPSAFPLGDPSPFGPTISFTTPYTYQGGDLVMTIRHPDATPTGSPAALLDAVSFDNSDTGYRALESPGESATTGLFFNVAVVQLLVSSSAAPEPSSVSLVALAALNIVPVIMRRRRIG